MQNPGFSTTYEDILLQVQNVDPVAYGKTRNYIDGAVTRLSPYISRGVISTRMLMEHILGLGIPFQQVEKLIQELAWRDYWQQIWVTKGPLINEDLKQAQSDVHHHEIPVSILNAKTGIEAIDKAIREYYSDGYLHNHVRMYIASLCCNLGKSHWKFPARWMYYHLIDGDWASNALSWQWVSGANANKKYYANQENINRYCYTDQKATFLDQSYEKLVEMGIPDELKEITSPELSTVLPPQSSFKADPSKPLLIYNYYNLDPGWKREESANRVLLLEPSVFQAYPICQNAVNFMLALSENIAGIQIYVGEFGELLQKCSARDIHYKEHPLNANYRGYEEPREWMFSIKGYFPSFFAFWKKCKRELDEKGITDRNTRR